MEDYSPTIFVTIPSVETRVEEADGLKNAKAFLKVMTGQASKAFTVYNVHIKVSQGLSWVVPRRFSNFVDLNSSLAKEFPVARRPELPDKTLLKAKQFDEMQIEQRRRDLESYLQAVVRSRFQEESKDLRKFLCLLDDCSGPDDSVNTSGITTSPKSPGSSNQSAPFSKTEGFEALISRRPELKDDASVTVCPRCSDRFTAIVRKHHCRHCGGVFCGKCAAQFMPIHSMGYSSDVRVCSTCAVVISSQRSPFESSSVIAAFSQVDMVEVLPNFFDGYNKNGSLWMQGKIPATLLSSFQKKVKLADEDVPVVFVDTSRNRTGYQGLLFSTGHLYFYHSDFPDSVGLGRFSYAELFRQKLYLEDDMNLHVGPQKILNVQYSGLSAKDMHQILENLKAYMSGKILSAQQGGKGQDVASPRSRKEPSTVGFPRNPDSFGKFARKSFSSLSNCISISIDPDIPGECLANWFDAGASSIFRDDDVPIVFVDLGVRSGSKGGESAIVLSLLGLYASAGDTKFFISWQEVVSNPLPEVVDNVVVFRSKYQISFEDGDIIPSSFIECLSNLIHSLKGKAKDTENLSTISCEPPAGKPRVVNVTLADDDIVLDKSFVDDASHEVGLPRTSKGNTQILLD